MTASSLLGEEHPLCHLQKGFNVLQPDLSKTTGFVWRYLVGVINVFMMLGGWAGMLKLFGSEKFRFSRLGLIDL